MAVKVSIPIALQGYTGGNAEITLKGKNVRALLQDLVRKSPELKQKIFNDAGQIMRFINIYVNDEDIRTLKQTDTSVRKGDRVLIIFAIAGG